MGATAQAVRALLDAAISVTEGLGVAVSLVVISVVSGLLMLVVLARMMKPSVLERARDQMAAAVYELRLFIDSPRRVISAQSRLIWWNLRYTWGLAPAVLVLTPPLGLLYAHLEVRYGYAPVEVAQPLVVRVELATGVDPAGIEPEPGLTDRDASPLAVTAPPLWIEDERIFLIRVEARTAGAHELALDTPAGPVTKRIVAGDAAARTSPERVAGMAQWWAMTDEPPIPDEAGITVISIDHAPDAVTWFGLALPWWGWWLILSTLTVVVLRKPFGVEF